MDIGSSQQAEWNGGTFTNLRIHNIREEMKVSAITKDLENWLALLVQINHELYGFETDKQKIEIRNQLSKLADDINKYQAISNASKIRRKYIPADLIDSLHNVQYILDAVFHKSGLQTKIANDSRHAFG